MSQYTYRDSHKAPDKGSTYDEDFATLPWRKFLWSREQNIILRIIKKYFVDRDIHLLDFACGTGRIAAFLENRVTTSTGVDVSTSMLDMARQKLKRTEIIQADITCDNILQDRRFNLITAFRFFLNAEDELKKSVLKILVHLLAEDGYFVFNNHRNKTSPLVWGLSIYNRMRGEGANFMTMREMRELVENAGLEIVEIYPVGFLPLPRTSLSDSWNHRIDEIATKFKCLSSFSESPIAVCRRHTSQNSDEPIKGRH